MTVSVMITTRGRIDDLRRTFRVLQELRPQPPEVLVTEDQWRIIRTRETLDDLIRGETATP